MACFPIALSLISAFVPAAPAAANQVAATPAPLVAQATTPEPVAPPPPVSPPPQTATMASPSPGYAYPPPPPSLFGGAPALKGPSVWGILPYSYGAAGIGVGARFMIPLAIQPLLKNTNVRDNFSLEFGADYLRWSFDFLGTNNYAVNEFLPAVGMAWNVWLNGNFALYPKVELGYQFVWLTGFPSGYPTPSYGGFYWDVAGGAMYKLNGGVTLRAEIGYAGLKAGVGWLF